MKNVRIEQNNHRRSDRNWFIGGLLDDAPPEPGPDLDYHDCWIRYLHPDGSWHMSTNVYPTNEFPGYYTKEEAEALFAKHCEGSTDGTSPEVS